MLYANGKDLSGKVNGMMILNFLLSDELLDDIYEVCFCILISEIIMFVHLHFCEKAYIFGNGFCIHAYF